MSATTAATAAGGLIRRHRCNFLGFSQWPRYFATQTTTPPPPQLLVSSSSKPSSRYLYNLSSFHDSSSEPDHLKLDRELILPKISKNRIIGSSQGYIISIPTSTRAKKTIHAINPLTGHVLHIPPPAHSIDDLKGSKLILSPSLDMAVLVLKQFNMPVSYLRLPSSSSPSSPSFCWNTLKLPPIMCHVTDCIFHKGCLCLVDEEARVTIFDDQFIKAEDDPSASPLSWTYYWDWDEVQGQDGNTNTSILMESHDGNDLYGLFRNCEPKYLEFRLFKLDRGFRHWEEVETIGGDSVVFVGHNDAMSFPAHDFPLLQPDSVYFSGDDFRCDSSGDGHCTGVYYLEDQSFEFLRATKGDQILTPTDLPPIWLKPSPHRPR